MFGARSLMTQGGRNMNAVLFSALLLDSPCASALRTHQSTPEFLVHKGPNPPPGFARRARLGRRLIAGPLVALALILAASAVASDTCGDQQGDTDAVATTRAAANAACEHKGH